MSKKNSSVLNLKNILEKNDKIFLLYSKFKKQIDYTFKKKSFLVAVSGGPDSLGLAALSKIYQYENRNKVIFCLIDHGIRKDSDKEAETVKKLLKKQKINLKILRNTKDIKNNIQSNARNIRYQLLSDFCKKNNIKFIFTGHHSEDQIETFLIRLSRGSGVQGLSSMNKVVSLKDNVKIVRPLLNFRKKDLIYISKTIFKKFISDSSNKNKKYLRTKVRNLILELEKNGIQHDQIIKSINNLASTRDTLNKYIENIENKCLKKQKGKILINLKILFLEPKEVQLKIVSNAIKNFKHSYYPPRSKKVINLLSQINLKQNVKLTLGGCILQKSSNNLLIKKEL